MMRNSHPFARRSALAILLLVWFVSPIFGQGTRPLSTPKLTNNPSWDITATSRRPLLSIFNATGGITPRIYEYQLSRESNFTKDQTLVFPGINETNQYITEMQIPKGKELPDGRWYWRARAIDAAGTKGPWAKTRFSVDATNSKTFMNLVRVKPKKVTVSSGKEPGYLVDWSDEGQSTYWLSLPLGRNARHWLTFDLGEPVTIARFWVLSNPHSKMGRLTDFVWQKSTDGKTWIDLPQTARKGNDTFRNKIDLKNPVRARYFRLLITGHVGLHAQVHTVILYRPGRPPLPKVPKSPYVLVIGNQLDGFTYTRLAHFVENKNNLGLKTVIVPHHQISLKMVQDLDPQPVAIICSGSNDQYQNMPMFEFYGEFELIRKTKIPLLGICAGHQYTCMAYGVTYVRHMGWFNESAFLRSQGKKVPPIHIQNKFRTAPIFKGIPSPFYATEVHSWAVSPISLPKEYEVTSRSKYIETLQSKNRLLFGSQFHGEVLEPFNQGGPYINNFLRIAVKKSRKSPKRR